MVVPISMAVLAGSKMLSNLLQQFFWEIFVTIFDIILLPKL
jgi:hypothetical protein